MYLKLLVAVQLDEVSQCVGNKAKGRNSNWMFKENKARRISRKTNIPPPDAHTHVCVSGGKKCSFFGKFGMFCFLETPALKFDLLPYYRRVVVTYPLYLSFADQCWSQVFTRTSYYLSRFKMRQCACMLISKAQFCRLHECQYKIKAYRLWD